MTQVKIKHSQHTNITTFINNKTIQIRNHEGWTDFDTAKILIAGPFGYEFAEPPYQFDPETWNDKEKHIVWNNIMPYFEGYGYVAQSLIDGLMKIGVGVSVFYKSDPHYLNYNALKAINAPKKYNAWGMWHHFWQKPGMLPFERRAIYTMWESTKLRPEWLSPLNEVNIVFVPCQHNIETFYENGIKTPMAIIHHGVDQSIYNYQEKANNEIFTFGTFGSLEPRKNIDVLIKAFTDEFQKENDIKLYIKDTNDDTYLKRKYGHLSKIEWNGQKVAPIELANIIRSFDVGVFPSSGEGFGLGGMQAMAVGTTCICTNYGGFREYLDDKYNYSLDYNLIDINNFASNNTTYSGQWADASYEHLRTLLRHTYERRDEVKQKGIAAAEWVKEKWTWERCAQQLVDTITKYEKGKLK